MTKERIAEIKERAEKATPDKEPKCPTCSVGVMIQKCMFELGGDCPRHELRNQFSSAIRTVEMNSRTDIPDLCAELERLRKENKRLKEVVSVMETMVALRKALAVSTETCGTKEQG